MSKPTKPTKPTTTPSVQWRFPVASSLVRDNSISRPARLLYLILQSYSGPSSPIPFPSLASLSLHMDMSRKPIQSHLRELESHGLLVRFKVKDKGRFHPSHYKLFPHKPKTKKYHRRALSSLWKMCPSKSTHIKDSISQPKLARKTPKKDSPLNLAALRRADACKPHCRCFNCRSNDAKNSKQPP